MGGSNASKPEQQDGTNEPNHNADIDDHNNGVELIYPDAEQTTEAPVDNERTLEKTINNSKNESQSDEVEVIGENGDVWQSPRMAPQSGPAAFQKTDSNHQPRSRHTHDTRIETLDEAPVQATLSPRGPPPDGSIILVGLVGSGKSTLKKQLHLLLSAGYSDEERDEYRHVIRRFLIAQSLELVLENWSYLNSLESEDRKPFTQYMQYCLDKEVKMRPHIPLCYHTREAVKRLWGDQRFKQMYRNNPVWRDSNLEEFADRVDELAKDSYEPTDLDIVKCFESMEQHKTLIVNFSKPKKLTYEVAEIRQPKAIQFKECRSLIFCVDISQVDTDHHKCCLKSAVIMFNSIINHPDMESKPVFIFFVKHDLLSKKLNELDMSRCFPEMKVAPGSKASLEKVCKHIVDIFTSRAPDRKIKHFFLNTLTDIKATQNALQVTFVDICNSS